MNYFSPRAAAERYAKGRPYHQDGIVERIREHIGIDGVVARALDVACGTGMSCTALKAVAGRIVGLDNSREMLTLAPRDEQIAYVRASAESLPVRQHSCDLVTVSSAFHWFDRTRFLPEAKRVLRPNGWLVVYNNVFPGMMRDVPEFTPWMRHYYAEHYPSPPRNWRPLDHDEAQAHGFAFVGTEETDNDVEMNRGQLVDYMLTQSNVIAAVQKGDKDIAEVRAWLLANTEQFYKDASSLRMLVFRTMIWYSRICSA